MASSSPTWSDQAAPNPRRWWVLAATCFGLFMAMLDVTIVNVALPTIGDDLHASLADLEWVINAYLLIYAVFLVTAGRIGDIFGRKRFFVAGTVLFAAGSLLCALAKSLAFGGLDPIHMLNIARGIQGLGSAFMMALSLAIISATFIGKERGLAIGIWGGVSGIALGLGPVIGGLLVDKVGWESVFYLNVPIGVISVLLCLWVVEESVDPTAARSVDVGGLITLSLSVFCLVFALIEGNDRGWGSTEIIGLFVAAVIMGIIFAMVEQRVSHPMVELGLFRNASFTGAAIVALALHGGLYSLLFYLTLYLQNLLGFSPLGGGLRLLPLSGLVFLVSPLAGALSDKLGAKLIMAVGLAIAAASTLALTVVSASDQQSDWLKILPALLLAGVASGLVSPLISTVAINTVDYNKAGMASGISGFCRQLGTAFGTALLGAVLTHQYNGTLHDKIPHLAMTGMPAAQAAATRDQLTNGLIQAGTFIGSTGLRNPPAAFAQIAKLPFFPDLQKIVREAFINGLIWALITGAILLVVGLAAALLVKRSDMVHLPAKPQAEPVAASSGEQPAA